MSASAVSPRSALVLADLVPGARVRDIALTLAGTAFITVAGYIAIPLPFTPVPLSLATFAVLLTGASLGPLRGSADEHRCRRRRSGLLLLRHRMLCLWPQEGHMEVSARFR